jgi:hypothetical protein
MPENCNAGVTHEAYAGFYNRCSARGEVLARRISRHRPGRSARPTYEELGP